MKAGSAADVDDRSWRFGEQALVGKQFEYLTGRTDRREDPEAVGPASVRLEHHIDGGRGEEVHLRQVEYHL